MKLLNSVRLFSKGLIIVTILAIPANAAPGGDAVEDIIYGCNQFIKLARKGRMREDAATQTRLGECLGAVRTMLATEVAADAICPAESVKLIDAVTAFSLYVIQNPEELKAVYVVPMRRAFRTAYPCSTIRQ